MKSNEDKIKDIEAAITGLGKLNRASPSKEIDKMIDKLHEYISKRWTTEALK